LTSLGEEGFRESHQEVTSVFFTLINIEKGCKNGGVVSQGGGTFRGQASAGWCCNPTKERIGGKLGLLEKVAAEQDGT